MSASGIAHRRTQPALFTLRLPFESAAQPQISKSNTEKQPREIRRLRSTERKQTPSRRTLGDLPIEILANILVEQADIATLEVVRQLNSSYKHLVESLVEYKLVRQHASHTMRVIHATRIAPFVTARQLFTEMCQPWCRTCGDGVFGPFVFLPTLSRCCNRCLEDNKRHLAVAPMEYLLRNCFLDRDTIEESLPIVHAFSGIYGDMRGYYTTKWTEKLVHVQDVEELALSWFRRGQNEQKAAQKARGGLDKVVGVLGRTEQANYYRAMKQYERWRKSLITKAKKKRKGWRKRQKNLASLLAEREPPQIPLPLAVPPLTDDVLRRWNSMATTDLPYWDKRKGRVEAGVYCTACTLLCTQLRRNRRAVRDCLRRASERAYTLETIPQHFKYCRVVGKIRPHIQNSQLDSFVVTADGEEMERDTNESNEALTSHFARIMAAE
ncbi:hypothetical protein FQN50_008851 [Emmonsiellopsis sp. PD_5]|nr:hypothetical protein FQN50_008851 [Emmonsiellopsis sp. PD_5]